MLGTRVRVSWLEPLWWHVADGRLYMQLVPTLPGICGLPRHSYWKKTMIQTRTLWIPATTM